MGRGAPPVLGCILELRRAPKREKYDNDLQIAAL